MPYERTKHAEVLQQLQLQDDRALASTLACLVPRPVPIACRCHHCALPLPFSDEPHFNFSVCSSYEEHWLYGLPLASVLAPNGKNDQVSHLQQALRPSLAKTAPPVRFADVLAEHLRTLLRQEPRLFKLPVASHLWADA